MKERVLSVFNFMLITGCFILAIFWIASKNVNAAQYEFDQSYTNINGEYTFSTSLREDTRLDLLDLNLGMSYMQREGYDVFKADAKAGFRFWASGTPYAFMEYDDSLDYKRVGAGYEHMFRSVTSTTGWEYFRHKGRVAAVYDSTDDAATWLAGYNARMSLPYADVSRETISLVGDVQVTGFGEKYRVSAEYRANEQLSVFGQYETERIKNKRDESIRQGIRIRI